MGTSVKVAEIMSRNVLVAHVDHSFTQLCRMLLEMKIHHLPVVDGKGKLVGMISSQDAFRALSFQLPHLEATDDAAINARIRIEELMTPNPVTTTSDKDVNTVARLFVGHGIRSLPVVENEQLVGIVTSNDVLRWFARDKG